MISVYMLLHISSWVRGLGAGAEGTYVLQGFVEVNHMGPALHLRAMGSCLHVVSSDRMSRLAHKRPGCWLLLKLWLCAYTLC